MPSTLVWPGLLLLAASAASFVGPLVHLCHRDRSRIEPFLDGFGLVLVAGLATLVVIPSVTSAIGGWGVLSAVAGFVLVNSSHRVGLRRDRALALTAVAFGLHVLLDGAALSIADESGLVWAVIAHRLPMSFALVAVARAKGWSDSSALGLAAALAALTSVGYLAGASAVDLLPAAGTAVLEAFVAGALLHVVVNHRAASPNPQRVHVHGNTCSHEHPHQASTETHAHHPSCGHGHDHRPSSGLGMDRRWSAAGALAGVGMLSVLAWVPMEFEGARTLGASWRIFARLLGETAPALLLGFALAGIVPFVLTPARMNSLGRGGRLMQALRGVLFGLPLPVCSCGVLPMYVSLVRRGAPTAAGMAFFVATPELGLDAVLLSVPLLGVGLTVARVLAAFSVAVLVGLVLGGISRGTSSGPPEEAAPFPNSWRERLEEGLRFGFVELFDHTMPWILLGLVVTAVAAPSLSGDIFHRITPVLQVPLATLVGIPMYVCASGATPIAALALHEGMSTGAVVAFLIAGPATNVTTFAVLSRLHGARTAVAFGVAVSALATLAGWTLDLLEVTATPTVGHALHAPLSPLGWGGVGLLLLLVAASIARQGPRGVLNQILHPIHVH